MQIHLLRHGIAEEGRAGAPDSERALTGEGKKKLRDVLRAAKSAGVQPSLILTSPYRRAVETAELAAEMLEYKEELLKTKSLVPNANPDQVWDEIRVHKQEPEILLSSHEPLLGYLFAHLLGTPSLMVDIKKGALARIDMEQFGAQPRGVLRWLFGPKIVG